MHPPRVSLLTARVPYAAYSDGPVRYTTAGLLPSQRRMTARQRGSSSKRNLQDDTGEENPQSTSVSPSVVLCGPSIPTLKPFLLVTFNMGSASDDKLEWVCQYLAEHKPDVMCIQETKCADYPAFLYQQGYQLHSHPSDGTAGGLLTLIKVQWRATQLETLRSERDVCWSSLSLGESCGHIVVANTYSRSNLSLDELSVTVGSVVTRLNQLSGASNAHKVLVGDLNIDHIREGDVERHKYLSRILAQANMVRVDLLPPLNTKPTCFPTQDRAFASSHIDVLALDESLVYGAGPAAASGIDPTPRRAHPSQIVSLDVDMDIGLAYLSQHKPVWVKFNIKSRARPKPPPDIVFRRNLATTAQWKKAKTSIASMCLSMHPQLQAMRQCPVQDRSKALDEFMMEFTSRLHRSYAKSIGTIKVNSNSAPSWSSSLSDTVRRKHAQAAVLHKACKTGQAVSLHLAEKHRATKRALKSGIRRSNRVKHSQQVRRASSSSSRISLVWKRSKRYSAGQTKVFGDSCMYKGATYTGAHDVAEALTQKMRDVHTYVPDDPAYDQRFHDEVAQSIPDLMQHDPNPCAASSCQFAQKDFDCLLARIADRAAKSPGPDGVPYWMITKGGGALHSTLLELFNLMWEWEIIPTSWGHSHIRYLHKKKSKLDLSNYRPISLISCLGKAFTMMWLPRIAAALLPHLVSQQGSKGKGCGSMESLWTLTSLIDSACAQGQGNHVHAMFCDTSTAYDTVWRDGMYFTLYSYGVRGPLLRMIRQWHEGATMTGLWYDIEGATIPYSQGVRQGCVLAPLLYVAFINPLVAPPPTTVGHLYPDLAQRAYSGGLHGAPGVMLPTATPNTPMQTGATSTPLNMFVDDVALLTMSRDSLQQNVDVYARHCHKWRYTLSWGKFQYVVFGWQYQPGTAPSVLAPGDATPIKSLKFAKYLGCWLDGRRTSKEHVRDAESKANAQSGLLATLSNNLGTADAAYVMDKKVIPHALYGLEAAWVDDKSLAQLDDTVTGRSCFRAFGLPTTSRKSVRLYQSSSLHASRQVRLSGVRFVAKLARDPDPIRKVLVQQQLTARTPPPASHRLFARAKADFARVLSSPDGNPFKLLHNTPTKGPGGLTKHRLRTLISRVKWNLKQEQTTALQADLALQAVDGIKGRKSTFLFATQLARPRVVIGLPNAFEEGRKTQDLSPYYRKYVDRIRYGDMATPVNPSHNIRQTYAIRQAAISARRARRATALPPRPIGATMAPVPRSVVSDVVRANRQLARSTNAAARVLDEGQPAPPCGLCGLRVPDAQHLTFECP